METGGNSNPNRQAPLYSPKVARIVHEIDQILFPEIAFDEQCTVHPDHLSLTGIERQYPHLRASEQLAEAA